MFGPRKIQGVQERDGSRPKTDAVKRKRPHLHRCGRSSYSANPVDEGYEMLHFFQRQQFVVW